MPEGAVSVGDKIIKVCFIAPKTYALFNPEVQAHFGGANVDLYYLSTELAKDSDFAASFITADYGQEVQERHQEVEVIKSLNLADNQLTAAKKVWQAMRRADADIYVFKTASPATPLIAMFCRRYHRKFVYRTAHQDEADGTYLRDHPFWGRAFLWALGQAAQVITQNSSDGENFRKNAGIASIAIPNGHRLQPIQDCPRNTILWVGRSVYFKQPHLFLDLAKCLPHQHFTMICQAATGDDGYAQLQNRAAAIANLQFIESVPFHEVQSYFNRARVFVNTSIAEGFPNTYIQSCQSSTPIVSLQVDPDDFLEKHGCGHCAGGDFSNLVSLLTTMVNSKYYRDAGRRAREYVERHHDVKRIVEQYKAIFKILCKRTVA